MEAPPAEELLRKIQDLQASHAHLQEDISRLRHSGYGRSEDNAAASVSARQRSHSLSPRRPRLPGVGPGRRKLDHGGGDGRASGGLDSSVLRKSGSAASFGHWSSPLQRESRSDGLPSRDTGVRDGLPPVVQFTDGQYLNILQSMGQSVHIFDRHRQIIYWNRTAENLYGYSAAEALGKDVLELLVDENDMSVANNTIHRVMMGENWTGQIPIRSKLGRRILIIATDTPFYDDDGTLIGIICVSSDTVPFQDNRVAMPDTRSSETDNSSNWSRNSVSAKLGLDPEQPLQMAIASRITGLASKVSNRVRSRLGTGDSSVECEGGSGDGHDSGHLSSVAALSGHKDNINSSEASTSKKAAAPSFFGVISQAVCDKSRAELSKDSEEEGEGKPSIREITSKAEAWIVKKARQWPWKGNEKESSEVRSSQSVWPSLQGDQDNDCSTSLAKAEIQTNEHNLHGTAEAFGSWSSSFNANSTSSSGSCGSTNSSALNKLDIETDCLDYEILWGDLTIGELIGQGSCGTVYHGLWYGSDVAIKVFSRQEYTEELIFDFRQEVSLMKQLRHPNILLFMGAVTAPQHLSIVTEFLPRGSLFNLLKKNTYKLDYRRRTLMALDIARGMNYLHHCSPPVIHRDLKSSNLLVDKNWSVKVADFGLSRIKYETYLTTKTGKGTPQWMAPEVLRSEPSDEKSDIYSFGVILWELATERIPWEHLNSMQVIGAVGFMNQSLDIPKEVDLKWASIIESCWRSEPQQRPSFQELLEKLRDLAKQYALQFQAARCAQ